MIAFVGIDVLLVVAALSTNRVEPGEPAITPTVEPATQTPAPSGSDDSEASPAGVTSSRFLTAVSETTAWRASAGSCDGGAPVVERTTDGGESWHPLDVSDDGVRQVLALKAGSEKYVAMVALVGDSCEVADLRSFTAGDFWETFDAGAERLAYVDPAEPARVFAAGEPLIAPCDVHQVVSGPPPAGLCDDLVQVENEGEWRPMEVNGALTLTGDADGLIVATTGSDDCAGIGLVAIEGGAAEPTGCLATASEPDMVTIGKAGGALWLWLGDRSYVSSDYGRTW